MPYYIRKVRGKNCYTLKNKDTGHAFAKCTTLSNAKKQMRLLKAIKYNKSFKPRKQMMGKGKSNKTRKATK